MNDEASFEGRLDGAQAIKDYVLAGNATITLRSAKTGIRYTFNIRKPREREVMRISLLIGPDRYAEIGSMTPEGGNLQLPGRFKGQDGYTAPALTAFRWFWERVMAAQDLPNLEVWHEGVCGRCGRQLTVPESIQRGIGPECIQRMAADAMLESLF
jgi:hypothetical protein